MWPVDGVGAQEGDVDAGRHGVVGRRAHHLGPVLIVPEADEGLVVGEQGRLRVQVEVGRVRDVETEALGQEEKGELVPDEVGGAPGGPVIGDGRTTPPASGWPPRRGPRRGSGRPGVVRLRGGDRAHNHEGGVAGVVTHDQRHVAVGAPGEVADDLEEVVARRPVRRNGHREGRLPVALDHVRPGRHRRGRLRLPGQVDDVQTSRPPVPP